jgi:transglutaminase-like putative cysteine protease
MPVDPRALLPAPFVESDHPDVIAFAHQATAGAGDAVARAVRLFYAVRDGIYYDPYVRFKLPEVYSAAYVLARRRGFCIPKAALLAALARAVGIPARLGFADVRNHLATPKLLEVAGGSLLRWHAWTELHLEGRWVKATPTFNLELCERFGLHALDWDGRGDSIFLPFDREGRLHLEYENDHGTFYEVPFEQITACYRRFAPLMMGDDPWGTGADFAAEAVPA